MRIAVVGATGLIGSALVKVAEDDDHDVIALSKEVGTDVLWPEGLAESLDQADAVVDVTQSPSLNEAEATAFFSKAADNLGLAAAAADVRPVGGGARWVATLPAPRRRARRLFLRRQCGGDEPVARS